jgi:large subunit ribosomal protein L32
MTVPKRRLSKMKGRTRRSHDHALIPIVTKCFACGETISPHGLCPKCQTYRGRSFVSDKPKPKAEAASEQPDDKS